MNREATTHEPTERAFPKNVAPVSQPALGRCGLVFAALVMALSIVGFISGILDRAEPVRALQTERKRSDSGESLLVPRYQQMNSAIYGPNRAWQSDLSRLPQVIPGLFDPVIRTPEMKNAALADRLRTRAFDGAPPAIPHLVDQISADSCLACHGKGMILDGKVATRMSHQLLTNCTQCHVEKGSSFPREVVAVTSNSKPDIAGPGFGAAATTNLFEGILRAGPGTRLMTGAPPTIPHSLFMREDCLSCHGLVARAGLRTTHPWLSNCQQCHAADGDRERSFPTLTSQRHVPDSFGGAYRK